MKKRVPGFLVIILIAFPTEAEGLKFDGGLGVFSLLWGGDFPIHPDSDVSLLLGIGFDSPLLFNPKEIEDEASFIMIKPLISAEYSFSMFDSKLLRVRTCAHFGKFQMAYFLVFAYYTGLSGAFLKDFTNGAIAFGISPEIGFEFSIGSIGTGLKLQYDFYTDERYNRFVLTGSLRFIISAL